MKEVNDLLLLCYMFQLFSQEIALTDKLKCLANKVCLRIKIFYKEWYFVMLRMIASTFNFMRTIIFKRKNINNVR